jgi:hypothetical protein
VWVTKRNGYVIGGIDGKIVKCYEIYVMEVMSSLDTDAGSSMEVARQGHGTHKCPERAISSIKND